MNLSPSSGENFANSPRKDLDDERLDNVLAAIREESVPPMRDASPVGGRPASQPTVRLRNSGRSRQVAWPALVTAAVVLIGMGFVFLSLAVRPVYGEIQAAIKAATSISFTVHARHSSGEEYFTHICVEEPGKSRATMTGARSNIQIMDLQKEMHLELDPENAKAVLSEVRPNVDFLIECEGLLNEFLNIPEKSIDFVGTSKLDDLEVDEFVAHVLGGEYHVFVDPQTDLPVRMELKNTDSDGNVAFRQVISNFEFDGEIDPSVFDLTVPDGYETETIAFGDPPPQNESLVVSPEDGLNGLGFGSSKEDIVSVLGSPNRVEQSDSFPGMVTLHYSPRGLILQLNEEGLTEIFCVSQQQSGPTVGDFSGTTSKGIAIGATVEDVFAAYGEPELNQPIVCGYFRQGLEFSIDEGLVTGVCVKQPTPEVSVTISGDGQVVRGDAELGEALKNQTLEALKDSRYANELESKGLKLQLAEDLDEFENTANSLKTPQE